MIEPSTRVIRIGEDGAVTLSMPEMGGQYLVIEEEEGRIVLRPYDLRWQGASSAIAKIGPRLHYVRTSTDRLPEA